MRRPYRLFFMSKRHAARGWTAEAVVNRRCERKFRAASAAEPPERCASDREIA
jgi:hypothetical protein